MLGLVLHHQHKVSYYCGMLCSYTIVTFIVIPFYWFTTTCTIVLCSAKFLWAINFANFMLQCFSGNN